MYVHHFEFNVVPEKFDRWAAYAHNYLSVMSRMPGLAIFRLLRGAKDPYHILSIRTWRSKADCERALASLEAEFAALPNRQEKFSKDVVVREFRLLDIAWGRKGAQAFNSPTMWVWHIEADVVPEKFDRQWVPWTRNFVSVFARQKGTLGEEFMRSTTDPYHIIAIRTYESEAAARAQPSIEQQTAGRMNREGGTYRVLPTPVEYTLFDMVWGPDGQQAFQEFMLGLEPV